MKYESDFNITAPAEQIYKLTKVKGEYITIKDFEQFKFFVYKDEYEDFVITEFTTGAAVCRAPLLTDAIKGAERYLNIVGSAVLKKILEKLLRKMGKQANSLIILIAFFLLTTIKAHTQIYGEFAIGISTTKSPTVSPSLGYNFHNAVMQLDLIPVVKQDQPVYAGLRVGYNFKFGNMAVQPFAGQYYEAYTLDKYDWYKNGWRLLYGAKLYYKEFFIQAQNADMAIFSFGITETLHIK